MNYKLKLVVAVAQELGADFNQNSQALIFLICSKYLDNNIYYQFIPSESGPISIQLNNDLKLIAKKNLTKRYATELDFYEKIAVQSLKNDWGNKLTAIPNHIKESYPHFYSETADASENSSLFTIGYEGSDIDTYINKLLGSKIKLLCDVRKNAYSQKFGFSKNELKSALKIAGIEYLHIPDLGIESEKRLELKTEADYISLFKDYDEALPSKLSHLNKLAELCEINGHIAITCFEANHNHCHRGRIAKFLSTAPFFKGKIAHL